MITIVVKPPSNCSWLTWAGAVSIMTGGTVVLLAILDAVLAYYQYVAPAFLLLALFVLWVVTTIYVPPPRTARIE